MQTLEPEKHFSRFIRHAARPRIFERENGLRAEFNYESKKDVDEF